MSRTDGQNMQLQIVMPPAEYKRETRSWVNLQQFRIFAKLPWLFIF